MQIPDWPEGGLDEVKKEGRQNIIIPGMTCFFSITKYLIGHWTPESELASNLLRG